MKAISTQVAAALARAIQDNRASLDAGKLRSVRFEIKINPKTGAPRTVIFSSEAETMLTEDAGSV